MVHDYNNIQYCLISDTVTCKDYHTSLQIDQAVNLFWYILGQTAINDAFYSKHKFKFSFLLRSFSA